MGVAFIFYFIQFCIGVLQSSISFPCYLLPLKLLYCLTKYITQMKEYWTIKF